MNERQRVLLEVHRAIAHAGLPAPGDPADTSPDRYREGFDDGVGISLDALYDLDPDLFAKEIR
jgi:hypothetical protein